MSTVESSPLTLPARRPRERGNGGPGFSGPSQWPHSKPQPARDVSGRPTGDRYVTRATRDLSVALAALEAQAISLPDDSGLVLVPQRDLHLVLRAYERLCLDTALVFAAKKQGVLKDGR